jgi:hypothetical protein
VALVPLTKAGSREYVKGTPAEVTAAHDGRANWKLTADRALVMPDYAPPGPGVRSITPSTVTEAASTTTDFTIHGSGLAATVTVYFKRADGISQYISAPGSVVASDTTVTCRSRDPLPTGPDDPTASPYSIVCEGAAPDYVTYEGASLTVTP